MLRPRPSIPGAILATLALSWSITPPLALAQRVEGGGGGAPADPAPARRDAALIERWGRGVLTGPIPDRPREVRDPPRLPATCLVWTTGKEPRAAREALFLAHLGPDGTRPDAAPGSHVAGRWTPREATTPGVWSGAFDHAYLLLPCRGHATVFARLSGAATLIVNGAPFHGDPERRGLRGVPVPLRDGDNDLFVVDADGGFELELWTPETRVVLGTWDARVGDCQNGIRSVPAASTLDSPWASLVLPVFNASSFDAELEFHYGHLVPEGPAVVPPLHEWADGGHVAPLCFMLKFAYAHDLGEPWPADAAAGVMALCAFGAGDRDADRQAMRVARDDAGLLRPGRPLSGLEPRLCDLARSPLLVHATAGDQEQRASAIAIARWLQQRLWYENGVAPEVVADHELAAILERRGFADAHLVLIGDAKRSHAFRALARFDDLRALLPDDIARDADPAYGLRVVGPEAMPAGLPAAVSLVHSRTAEGLLLFAALDLSGDPRLDLDSFKVLPAAAPDALTVVPMPH